MVRYNYLVPIVAKPCFTFSYLSVAFIYFQKEKTPQSIEITAFLDYVDEKDAPIQRPISSSRKPSESLLLEKKEQRNECALTF